MYTRHLAGILQERFRTFRSVYVHGMRQVGKTTLCRTSFPDLPYASLENPDTRTFALEDPRGFLAGFPDGAILDEIQKAPNLLSYLQQIIDENRGKFVLTGSQNLLLMEGVSQSLAGRINVLHMSPLSRSEIAGRNLSNPLEGEFTGESIHGQREEDLWREIFLGGFPQPRQFPDTLIPWADSYISTYLERDARSLLRIQDLGLFQRFLTLCAARSGQLLNIASLASDSGVSEAQCRRWLGVFQVSEIVFLLQPFHENLGKRVIKSPKLYFTDTGLLCRLLGIASPQDIIRHPLMGALFETFIVNELRKSLWNKGIKPYEYFWREKTGIEIDYLLLDGIRQIAFECKAGRTLDSSHLKNLQTYLRLRGDSETTAFAVYGGDQEVTRSGVRLIPWWRI